ncbi:MAG: SIS domain-containing protein [Armatimonadota bacterium]|nr:SIS domain-containing protein [Armatimonadota bacterium]MDR7451548.1 SIS domain-containing protein [Armatimonadota bacterium]MDR7467515.1 SIS domain-containing protein [Armatimonadota bacterium]MDR7494389.1 SIS domain-containing protein [Armatimonadota bacterium]MDR7499206.1 SIS domain-containing protein [Armatimonadota bacterium]
MAQALGRYTEEEIRAQPEVWERVLGETASAARAVRQLWETTAPDQILLTGCGSSYYLAIAAAHLLQDALRVPCRALPSSEILFASEDLLLGGRPSLLIAVSRSGETTETVWAARRLRDRGATTLAVTCAGSGPLLQASQLALVLPVEERSIVMTASFTSLLLALAYLAADLAGDSRQAAELRGIPAVAAGEIDRLSDQARGCDFAARFFVYLGSGAMFAIACEGALKMTEMALTPGCAYHTLEYLHGPKAAASEGVVIGVLSSRGAAYEREVLRQVAGLGARVIALGDGVDGVTAVPLPVSLGSVAAMLLDGIWLQWLALHAARARGVDPDTPRFLQPVVTWARFPLEGGEQ